MSEAILLRGGGEKPIHTWKKYDLQENVSYTWNKWNLVSTTVYKWNKWNTTTGYANPYLYESNARILLAKQGEDGLIFTSYSIDQDKGFVGTGTRNVPLYVGFANCVGWHSFGSTGYGTARSYITGYVGINSGSDLSYTADIYKIGKVAIKGSTSYGQVTSTSSSAYPSNGASGSYWYVSAGSTTSYSKGSTQQPDVSSTSSTAYPDDGHDGSYWYNNKQTVINRSMGNYIEDVFSLSQDTYPANGIAGSYWYVYQGKL